MQWLESMSSRKLVIIGLALAAVVLLSVNVLAGMLTRSWQVDLTGNKLFTITQSTRDVLTGLDEPVTIKLYYSKALGDQAPQYGAHAERARGLLERYAGIADSNLKVEVIDPEPFSDGEDRAVAAGLQGASLSTTGQAGYLGVVGSNSTDDQETIAFLSIEREDFLEYDLTKMIHKLGDPVQKNVGLVTSLGIAGGMDPQRGRRPAWVVHQQISEFFNITTVDPAGGAIADDIDILLLAAPGPLTPEAANAIDQFALSGKPVVAFLDPFAETHPQQQPLLGKDEVIHKLLEAWGARIEPDKVVGDIKNARQVQFNVNGQLQVGSYVPWLNLDKPTLDQGSSLFSSIEHLVMASAGSISAVDGAGTKFSPLIRTSEEAMLIDAKDVRSPDPLSLLNAYKPGGKSHVLAARLTGQAKTAFADGAPKADGAKADDEKRTHLSSGNINVVLVSDADMLFDSFWAQVREMLGQRIVVPRAHNAVFLLNTLENVSGGTALADLRGRGVAARPFTMVQDIRRKAEGQFRQREQELNTKLQQTQSRLSEIQSRAEGGNIILSDEDKQAILGVRTEIVKVRQDLREVQRSLMRDIESLGFWVKALNIAGVPALIGLAAGGIALTRRRRRPGSRGQ